MMQIDTSISRTPCKSDSPLTVTMSTWRSIHSSATARRRHLWSTATWSTGVPTLLPEVDRVVFYDAEREKVLGAAEWSEVCATVPHLLIPTPWIPRRWRVEAFPTDAERRTMATARR